ncbi:RNA polymerase sigma factor region1.1 domain-containing protein [Paracraurococcus lichenis]|uniref:RNA polymerase sigma factor region1.1 domain-containing protein n=1 Tax=Paracraurococcus lichenis TaxID=3064888 RepID=A0ABT9DY45_9PROT|nr:RNA polymerase sigma factor region1.1 domain-containing protein [Paracraurococcus sp. LOR1-02]MDO9708813.1 RNA polymerase sigma factor region1.1 domain-containing protein [Paracraurococcus sp. LOR1-02]
MAGNPFQTWVVRIGPLIARGKARGWVTRAEIRAALARPIAPEGLVGEFTAALKAKGVRVRDRAPVEDGLLLDAMTAALERLIERGKARGYVTYEEMHAALPAGRVSSELIEDTLAHLAELGISVVEAEEGGTEG